jgi:hypothetical protein
MKTDELGFTRAAANDGIHGEDEVATNEFQQLTEIYPMRRRIERRIKQAFAIARRDPVRTAEFVSDVLIIIGLLALVFIAWSSCGRGCA